VVKEPEKKIILIPTTYFFSNNTELTVLTFLHGRQKVANV